MYVELGYCHYLPTPLKGRPMKKSMLSLHLILILLVGVNNLFGGHSLNFDGIDDHVLVGTPNGMTPTESHTIMAWVKSTLEPCDYGRIIGDYLAPPTSPNNLTYGFSGCEPSCPSGNCMVMALWTDQLFTESQTIEGWTHWTFTYDSNTLLRSVYRDGILLGENNAASAYAGSMNLIFGAAHNTNSGWDSYFNGNLDEMALWNVPLTAQEISALYSSGDYASSANLKGYWKFDEGSGTSLTDLSGNGNDGTINGATWSTDIPPTPQTTDNRSLSFDGVEDHVFANSILFNTGDEVTISLWVNAETLASSSTNTFIRQGACDGVSDPDIYIAQENSNTLAFGLRTESGFHKWTLPYDLNPLIGAWHHLSFTYDLTDKRVYLDGVLLGTNNGNSGELLSCSGCAASDQFGSFDLNK
jgi:hypothetical protein